jgi:biopolymer transport protein ExbD
LGIDEHESITLNKKTMADLAALTAEIKSELLRNADVAVHLYADQSVNYGKVAEVMAAVQQTGIVKMGFVTVEKKDAPILCFV